MKKLSMFVLLGVLLGTLTAGSALADPAAQGATLTWDLARICSDTDEIQVYVSIRGVTANYAAQLLVARPWPVPVVEAAVVSPMIPGGQVGYPLRPGRAP